MVLTVFPCLSQVWGKCPRHILPPHVRQNLCSWPYPTSVGKFGEILLDDKIGPRFGSDHRLRPDSDDSRLILARTCFYQLRRIRQAKKNLDEDSVKTLVHALVLSSLDYCNSVLANLQEVTLALLIRVQHFAHSKSPETGFRIAGNDGAPLAPSPSWNNIQIVYIDARHPPRSLP